MERKNIRLENYDYSSNGLYFITICTKERVKYLSEIICDNDFYGDFDEYIRNVGDGVLDVPYKCDHSIIYINIEKIC